MAGYWVAGPVVGCHQRLGTIDLNRNVAHLYSIALHPWLAPAAADGKDGDIKGEDDHSDNATAAAEGFFRG